MAIQGIMQGFANPDDLSKNVVLVGRGPEYLLLVDGAPVASHRDLDNASPAFCTKALELCKADWRQVKGLRHHNANSTSEVLEVGDLTFAQMRPQLWNLSND